MKKQTVIMFILFLCKMAHSQDIDSALANAATNYAYEKIYLQYNKQNYFAGETIWCKVYIQKGRLPVLCSSVKIELLNTNGSIIKNAIFPVYEGVASGNISIPENCLAGRYFIRTFSNTTQQAPFKQLSFTQPFLILNKIGSSEFREVKCFPEITTDWSFRKQPIIAGTTNHISYYLQDEYNKPIREATVLLIMNKDTILTSYSSEWGTGELIYNADMGQSYKALVCRGKDTLEYLFPNPVEGVGLYPVAMGKEYYVSINRSAKVNRLPKYLIGEVDFNLVFLMALKGNETLIKIPVDSIPSGILRISILDEKKNAINEGFVFVHHESDIIKFDKTKTSYVKAGDSIKIGNETNYPIKITGSASLSHTDNSSTEYFPKQNIVSRLFFTSYLTKWFSFIPVFFEKMDNMSISVLNNLLSTQNLNKPDWATIMACKRNKGEMQPPLYINFQVRIDDASLLPLKKKDSSINLILQNGDNPPKYWSLPITQKGVFEDQGLVFTDSAKIYYQLPDKILSNKYSVLSKSIDEQVKLDIEDSVRTIYFPNFTSEIATRPIKGTVSNLPAISENNEVDKVLSDVTVKGTITLRQKTAEVDKRYTKGLFSKEAEKKLDLINDPYSNVSMSVIDYINLKYPNLYARPIRWTYYLNEGLSNTNELKQVAIRDVALIKIFQSGFAMSTGGSPSIAVYLKKYDDLPESNGNRFGKNIFSIRGYDRELSFVPEQVADSVNLSTTYYWNPFFILSKSSEFSFVVRNRPEGNKEKVLIIEGFTSDGDVLFHKEKVNY